MELRKFDNGKYSKNISFNVKRDQLFLYNFQYIFFTITFKKVCVRFLGNKIVFEILNFID